MKINLVSCLFILESEKNENIRKNDKKKIKVLLNKKGYLPTILIQKDNMKQQARNQISDLIGSNQFHLEQVYTLDYQDNIDIIYLGITNKEHIKKINKDYQLVDFNVLNNNCIVLGEKEYPYKTIEKELNNNMEYYHEIETKDKIINRELLELLISYKKIRSSIDQTDIIFKFMGDSFTLEDVRIVYELIKECRVDKSNFRKKIVKYCEKTEDLADTKNGYRPSQRYRFKPLKGDIWI